jgi:hypothetical protein
MTFLKRHLDGSTQNTYYKRYRQLVITHAARPVLKAMEHELGKNPSWAFCSDQRQEYVRVRYLACYLLKKHTDMSLRQIASIISGGVDLFDHSTVSHGIVAIQNKIAIIGNNGNSRPVCKETYNLIERINHEIKNDYKLPQSLINNQS